MSSRVGNLLSEILPSKTFWRKFRPTLELHQNQFHSSLARQIWYYYFAYVSIYTTKSVFSHVILKERDIFKRTLSTFSSLLSLQCSILITFFIRNNLLFLDSFYVHYLFLFISFRPHTPGRKLIWRRLEKIISAILYKSKKVA